LGSEKYVQPVIKRRDPNRKLGSMNEEAKFVKKNNKMFQESDDNSLKY